MVDRSELDPDGVARRDFTTTFRGFDQVEVRAFLSSTAIQLRQVLDREAELLRRLDEAEQRAAQIETIDEHRIAEVLGEETARIFEAAREAAAEIRAKAEAKTAQLVRDAQDEANRVTSEAGELLRLRTTEADTAAAAIRNDAEAARDKMLADARVEVDAMRVQAASDAERIRGEAQAVLDQAVLDADATVEAARQEGRDMVAEAQVVRERILKDLARRRRAGKAQLEQLRAARERLLEAYALVRRTVDEATNELTVAVPEAKLAADAAARRADLDDDELTVEAIEAELDAGRVAGVPLLDTGEVPVVRLDDPPAPPPPPPPPPPSSEEPLGHEPLAESVEDDSPESAEDDLPESAEDERLDGEIEVEAPPVGGDEPSEVDFDTEVEGEAVDDSSDDSPDGSPEEADDSPDESPEDEVDLFAEAGEEVDENAGRGVDDLFARLRSEVPDSEAIEDHSDDPADDGDEVHDEPTSKFVVDAGDLIIEPPPVEAEAFDGATEIEAGPAGEDASQADETDEADEADEADETMLERRDRHLGDLEVDLARVLKRQLADDENEKLDLIRRRPAKSGVEQVLPPLDEHRQGFTDAVSDALVLAAAAGTELANELLHPDDPAPEVLDVEVDLDDIAAELVDTLLLPIRDRVAELVEGSEDDDALDGVRATYRRGKGAVAEVAAQFVHTAFNRGVFDAVPDGALVRWVVDPGAGPCPDGEDDALEGPIVKGTAFPTGHLHPPAHPGCRCLLAPGVL